MEIDERALVERGERHEAEISAKALDGEVGIIRAFVARAEQARQRQRERFHNRKRGKPHGKLGDDEPGEKRLGAVAPTRAEIVPRDGDAPGGQTDGGGNGDLEKLHHDAENGEGNLRKLTLRKNGVERAVFHAGVLHRRHRHHERKLGEQARRAEGEHAAYDRPTQREAGARKAHGLHVQNIMRAHRRRERLTDDGGDSRAHHAPAEKINENRVEHDVGQRARHRGHHGKARAAVTADDGVHGLAEHIKGYAEGDVKEIFAGKRVGFGVHRRAEKRENRLGENEIQRGEHRA